jgi:hypothetical protein
LSYPKYGGITESSIGDASKGRYHDGNAVNLAQLFGTQSANDQEYREKGTFITTDKDGNLEHLDANPWIKTMYQQILEKLQSGKLTEAYDQLKGVMVVNFEHGLNLQDVLADSLERSGLDDLAKFVLDKSGNEATIRAFASSPDGLASEASTLAQEELFSGSTRFICEDYRAKEMKDTQQAYEQHLERKNKYPELSYVLGRG